MSHSIGRNLAVLLLISVICLGVSSCGGGVSNGGSAAPSAFLFAADSGEGNPSLDVFTVSSSGSIALASGSPYTVNGPPASLIAASGEDHLLFADGGNLPVSSSLYVFRIGANGVLTSLGSPVLAIGFPSTLSVAPAGDFLFVDGQIFTIDAATGALALLGYAPASGPGMFSPDGRFIFSLDSFSGVESYTFTFDSKTGAATPVSSLGFLPFDTSPRPPVVHPSGKFVYVPYFADTGIFFTPPQGGIAGFAVAADGSLTSLPGSPFASGIDFGQAVIDPAGAHLYVTGSVDSDNPAIGNFVYGFTIDQNSGALSPISGASPFSPGTPQALAFDPSGRYLFVAHQRGAFGVYSVGTDGMPTPLAGAPSFLGGNIISLVAIQP